MVEQKYNLYLVRFCILNWSIKYKRGRYLDIYIHISITSIYTLSQLMATSLLCGRLPSSCRGGRGRTWGTWSARTLPARRAGPRHLVRPPAQPLLPLHWTEGRTEESVRKYECVITILDLPNWLRSSSESESDMSLASSRLAVDVATEEKRLRCPSKLKGSYRRDVSQCQCPGSRQSL